MMFEVELYFHGDLAGFLSRAFREAPSVRRTLQEKTAIKDVIESCGVPHTEVDAILVGGCDPVTLSWQVADARSVAVHSVDSTRELPAEIPRLQLRRATRFVADGHLGTLAGNLRLLGLDTAYERDADDRRLLEIMASEERALLTRDRRLLMHSIVRTGYCPRSSDGEAQAREVLARFHLEPDDHLIQPYARCLQCNHPLDDVTKADVAARLSAEPLTLRYYEKFRHCPGCGRIFWAGTHYEKLAARVARLLST
jgi:uncharacterized protein with PIN domain